jgi:hypothetical protein
MNEQRRPLSDQDIVDLLDDLSHSEQTAYPLDLQKKRRAAFLAQAVGIAAVQAVQPETPALQTPAAGGGPAQLGELRWFAARWEGLLITGAFIVLVAELAFGLYTFRDQIRSWLTPATPTIIAPAPAVLPAQPGAPTLTARPTRTSPVSPSPTVLPTSTLLAPDQNPQATATLIPLLPTATARDGLHLGNTKTPRPDVANKTPGPKNSPVPTRKP